MLFVLVTLVAIICGWVAYQLSWIRQRHAFLSADALYVVRACPAPWSLRLFGEQGFYEIMVGKSEMDRAHSLLPESIVKPIPEDYQGRRPPMPSPVF
jgi:hypothetical protein